MERPGGTHSDTYDKLSQITLFAPLPEGTRRALARRAAPIHLPAGSILMREGGPGDALYALVSGRLRVIAQQPDGSQAAVGEISAGEVVGEMALLSDEPHSATVKAVRDSHLLEIAREDFETLGREEPTIMLEIARLMVARLRRSIHSDSSSGRVRSLALVSAGNNDRLDGFARQLQGALAEFGSVTVVTSSTVAGQLGPDHVDTALHSQQDLALAGFLNRLEASHDLVLYVTDNSARAWTQRCLRQADRVFHVVRAGASDHGGESVHGEPDVPARTDLVVVHPLRTPTPSDTSRRLEGRRYGTHHHVREDSKGDFERLARTVSGRAVGLVLSGGGARGLAHIGVLEALEEAGVPVDVIGGSSFGALIAAARARGDDAAGVREFVQRFLIDRSSPLDVTAPATALTAGKRIVAMLQEGFGDVQIEDLWHRFFCVSANLTKGRLEIHTAGPVWRAVRASISIPGLFPPVNAGDGDVLVDGAVMNNLPVDVIRPMVDGGSVVAVNLKGEFPLRASDLPHHGVLSGWRVFGRRINPLANALALPGIMDVLLRTTEVGSVLSSKAMEQEADLVFRPPVDDVGLLDFSAVDRLVEAGYRHAVKVLEDGGLEERLTDVVRQR